MSKANSLSWSFFPFFFQKSLHSHEPLVRMQITRRSTFESTLFCNRHAVFSSVNSSQKSFRPHFMIFKCMLVMWLRSMTREISEDWHMCPKTFFCHHQENPRNRLLNFVGMHPLSLSVKTLNLQCKQTSTYKPVLGLYPFTVYSFQFTTFLHIRCIYSRNQEHEVMIWVNKIRI